MQLDTLPMDVPSAGQGAKTLRTPTEARQRADRLADRRNDGVNKSRRLARRFQELHEYLAVAEKVTVALEQLNQQLFQQLLGTVQEKLTIALQEILEQPIKLCAESYFSSCAAKVDFWVERDGHKEDMMRGQGGSVINILSVGLRMFALTTLDERVHRRFLVLDEQDCWLRPDLVPRLVKIVHEAGRALGFQVLMISHHDVALFEQYADKIYTFEANGDSVEVREICTASAQADGHSK